MNKEQEMILLSQKMMEDNEFRLRTTTDTSENEIRDMIEYFMGTIRETENELISVGNEFDHRSVFGKETFSIFSFLGS